MAAQARATANKPAIRRPPRALPAAAAAGIDDEELIEISVDDPEQEPERVPLFKIGDTVYTMLADPPLTLAMEAMDVSYERGQGFGEVFIMREMLGEQAYRALLGSKSLKGPQYKEIAERITKRVYGVLEREGGSPNR